MKLPVNDISVETSGTFEEHSFGIGDTGAIFEILRSKIYSDPIGSICREVASNGRDANREVGNGHIPIKIMLPSSLDPHIRFIDCGPGITHDRAINIFIKYAASTKQNSNLFTGGFGLGAKVPFSYCDSFSIITHVDGVKYSYSAYIDETKVGKLALLSKIPTDEPNGTEIKIPVHRKDFNEFATKLEVATRWWDVQPEIENGVSSKRFSRTDLVTEGTNWSIYKPQTHSYSYGAERFTIVIDGISYPMSTSVSDKLSNEKDMKFLFSGHKQVVLFFNNGELNLVSNREQIQWDDKTVATVRTRFTEMSSAVYSFLKTTINDCSSYMEAVAKARVLNTTFDVPSNTLSWNGQPIVSGVRGSGASDKNWFGYSVRRRTPGVVVLSNEVDRRKDNYVELDEDVFFIINDTPLVTLTVIRAAQVFTALPDTRKKFVLIPKSEWEHKLEEIAAHIPHSFLSKHIVTKTPSGKLRKPRKTLYRYEGGSFSRSSFDNFESCSKNKLYIFTKKGYNGKPSACNLDGKEIYDGMFRSLVSEHNCAIYAFDLSMFKDDPSEFSDYTDDAEELMEFVKENILSKLNLEALFKARSSEFSSRGHDMCNNLANKIGTDSLFGKYTAAYNALRENHDTFNSFSQMLELNYPELKNLDGETAGNELEAIRNEIIARYPLVGIGMRNGSYYDWEECLSHYVDYISMVNTLKPV
jgi:hypothetical protein